MRINTSRLLQNDRSLMLAYDHGLENGPQDFNLKNIDPKYIMDIALEGRFSALIVQSGIAEKYYYEGYKQVPLVVKLNGKLNMSHILPISRQICSVDRAVKLGADAVGYTLFDGSKNEADIFNEFGKVVERAHDYGLPVIAWMYPRGEVTQNNIDTNSLAYFARMGLELGADFVNLKYNQDIEAYKWVVANAGRTRVLTAGGKKLEPKQFLERAHDILQTGVTGFAIGRNIWQDPRPYSLAQAMRELVFKNKKVEDVLHYIKSK